MKRIDAKINNQEFTFRTNNNGDYLFVGVSENRQISTESGFNSLRKIKIHIRQYLKNRLGNFDGKIQYSPAKYTDWRE